MNHTDPIIGGSEAGETVPVNRLERFTRTGEHNGLDRLRQQLGQRPALALAGSVLLGFIVGWSGRKPPDTSGDSHLAERPYTTLPSTPAHRGKYEKAPADRSGGLRQALTSELMVALKSTAISTAMGLLREVAKQLLPRPSTARAARTAGTPPTVRPPLH